MKRILLLLCLFVSIHSFSQTEISKELGKLDGLSDEEISSICEMIGLGGLKYFILKVDPRKNMTFNPKESIDFNGNTGSFIQYTHARICSVLRKAAEQGFSDAQHGLAVCYEAGIGVRQNMSQAIFWYRKAAEQGCDAAIEKLEELERKKDESLFNKLKKWISSDLPS